ncbi:hypothetical protein Salat_1290000 [Sesamum alatum]|uniref:RING-CH-type domain-containing protein n=1 Tax=Sesamum alatum TaxID=300844 RepID=A0AAE1YH01_9LAMI|nr:hypothetical protein Salat_1290000 [Sesamum alatum]
METTAITDIHHEAAVDAVEVVCCNKRVSANTRVDAKEGPEQDCSGSFWVKSISDDPLVLTYLETNGVAHPYSVNIVTQVTHICIVRSKKDEIIDKIPEGKAICLMCYDSLRENVENVDALKTKCGCESGLVHEKCAEKIKTCDYCEEVIHYMPVSLSGITAENLETQLLFTGSKLRFINYSI